MTDSNDNTSNELRLDLNIDSEFPRGVSGARVLLILDPSDGYPTVYTWSNVGPGVPEPLWNGRHTRLCELPLNTVPESVVVWCQQHADRLQQLAAEYEGEHWDGNNYQGHWSEAADDLCDSIEQSLSEMGGPLASYWDAADWFEPVSDSDLCADILEEAGTLTGNVGQREKQIIDATLRRAEHEVKAALPERLELADVLDYLTERAPRQCQCGMVTGELCETMGLEQDMVTVEWMPVQYRASHEAARNSGDWPHNGSQRLLMTTDCAEQICDDEPDWAVQL